MEILDIQSRVILNESGHFSFQIYNAVTGTVIFSPANWWADKETARAVGVKIREEVLVLMQKMGLSEMETFGGKKIFGALSENTVAVLAVLAVNKQTGRFGVAVMTSAGELIIKPDRWFDTADEAFAFARMQRTQILQECAKRGFSVKELGIDMNDFVPPTKQPEQPPPSPAQPKPKKSMPFLRPNHFDPTLN